MKKEAMTQDEQVVTRRLKKWRKQILSWLQEKKVALWHLDFTPVRLPPDFQCAELYGKIVVLF